MTLPALPPPRDRSRPYRVCFVCTGNICRSPMAAVVLRDLACGVPAGDGSPAATLADRLEVSSAGTGPWHEGEPMDPRAREALEAVGRKDHGHVAHQVAVADFADVDLMVALDRRHLETLRGLDATGVLEGRLVLLRSFDSDAGGAVNVPDPYYGDAEDFARCLTEVEAACRGLVASLAEAVRGAAPM